MLSSTFIDEIGYRSLDKQATTCLFQLISERYERGAVGETQGWRVDAVRRTGHFRRGPMIPAPRLRLKRATGWFAAGQEMATALEMLSDAAFKLYVFLFERGPAQRTNGMGCDGSTSALARIDPTLLGKTDPAPRVNG
jgi:predicted extracellular nuclease